MSDPRPLTAPELLAALEALGAACREPATLTLAGGGALALSGLIAGRTTGDADVIAADPAFSTVASAVDAVATTLRLTPRWMNDACATFARFLPADYADRTQPIGTFGPVAVRALGRADLILLKVLALRAQDADDLAALRPTADEFQHVLAQLPRLANGTREDQRRTVHARLYIGAELRAGRVPGFPPGVRPPSVADASAPSAADPDAHSVHRPSARPRRGPDPGPGQPG